MSKSSKLYANNGRIESSNPARSSQGRSEGPKVRNTGPLLKAVLEAIGTPDDLSHVDLKPLDADSRYRVNVYREVKGVVQMTDSYYMIAIGNTISSSNPPMKKKYFDADLERLSHNR